MTGGYCPHRCRGHRGGRGGGGCGGAGSRGSSWSLRDRREKRGSHVAPGTPGLGDPPGVGATSLLTCPWGFGGHPGSSGAAGRR